MKIADITIPLEQLTSIDLDVSKLPSGTPIAIKTFVYSSRNPGPTVLITGGIHGDEINGIEIVRRYLAEKRYHNLTSGTLIIIPVVNVYGFLNFSREVPDGKDVNRSFPGNANGSLASRVARELSDKIIPIIDFGIDYHTGGNSHYNFPQVRYSSDDLEAKNLAEVFNSPCIIAKKSIEGTIRYYAQKIGKPILVYEGGENLRLDAHSIEQGLSGLEKVLTYKNMLNEELNATQSMLKLTKTK